MKKSKNRKYLLILLVVLLLGLAVGYAAFSNTLSITGTANANGSFDMIFESCELIDSKGVKTGEGYTEGVISADKKNLTVNVANLAYPGAGAQFEVVVKNNGTMPAEITDVTTTNGTTGNGKITIEGLDVIATTHDVIPAEGTCTFSFIVKWDENVTEIDDDERNISFDLDIEYTQKTRPFTGIVDHKDE